MIKIKIKLWIMLVILILASVTVVYALDIKKIGEVMTEEKGKELQKEGWIIDIYNSGSHYPWCVL